MPESEKDILIPYVRFDPQMESQAVIRTVQKKRTTNFREDETKLLIQLWGSPQIQNKLYLTHRKAPVMRLLAATMQQRGFYRTPDEIKTRIRNLKCLYHRIKRTMACGTGLGTVDPDWPHFKAMDAILNKNTMKRERIDENIFEGPRCEDIKQEVDIDINDDIESWATNSMGSEAEEDHAPPPLTPAPATQPQTKKPTEKKSIQSKPMPTIIPSFTIPTTSAQQNQSNPARPTGTLPSIPLPLLILNSLQPHHQQNGSQEKKHSPSAANGNGGNNKVESDLHNLMRELVEVQKENLEIEKQRLDIEKQRLDFSRLFGSQLVTLVSMVGTLAQRLSFANGQNILDLTANGNEENRDNKNRKKRPANTDLDILKDSKILKTVLEQGIKKYMMGDGDNEEDKPIVHDESSSSNSNDK